MVLAFWCCEVCTELKPTKGNASWFAVCACTSAAFSGFFWRWLSGSNALG
jgi:hypothetical protein